MQFFKILPRYIFAKFIRPYTKYYWSSLFGILGFVISNLIHFGHSPLLKIPLFGEVLIGAILFLIIYFVGKKTLNYAGLWIENFVTNLIQKVLYDFLRYQTQRIIDTIKRETPKIETPVVQEFKYEGGVVLDTSCIIDGRILAVVETGFLDSLIVVSQNVLDELQYMADKSDSLKRQRGRRGLDLLKQIQKKVSKNKFKIVNLKTRPDEVDKSLVEFCKTNKCKIATVDFNLNKVAQLAGVKVLNVNELANEIKLNFLPGELFTIKLIQLGKEETQAVGYLQDGTMVVVKDASTFVGMDKEIIVDKVLQTSAGKMIFASLN